MTRGVPVPDPEVRLVGATPVELARALLRSKPEPTHRSPTKVRCPRSSPGEQPAAE